MAYFLTAKSRKGVKTFMEDIKNYPSITFAHDFELTEAEQLDAIEIAHKPEIVVSIEMAAKIKGVSKVSIYNAIAAGTLDHVKGVTLSSLRQYAVLEANQRGGISRGKQMQKSAKLQSVKNTD
jgi:hypothetical protein